MRPLCMSVCACMISWRKCMEGSDKHTCVVLAELLSWKVEYNTVLIQLWWEGQSVFYLKPRATLTEVSTEMWRGGNGYEQRRSWSKEFQSKQRLRHGVLGCLTTVSPCGCQEFGSVALLDVSNADIVSCDSLQAVRCRTYRVDNE